MEVQQGNAIIQLIDPTLHKHTFISPTIFLYRHVTAKIIFQKQQQLVERNVGGKRLFLCNMFELFCMVNFLLQKPLFINKWSKAYY